MSRGTTTIKIISSTSTTSTSGVMLISDCRPLRESPLSSCIVSVPPRLCWLRAFGDQPDPAEAGILNQVHRLPDFAEVESCVTPDHDLGVGVLLGTHRCAEGWAEILRGNLLIVDPQRAGVIDGNQDPASLVALLARLRRIWHADVRSLPHFRRHHHEDDQQYKHHVDERRDVDGRLNLRCFTDAHRPPRALRSLTPAPWALAP